MKTRIFTGAALVVAMICVFLLSGTWVYTAFCCLLSVIGTWEMLGCIGKRNTKILSVPALIVSAACPLCVRFIGIQTLPVILTALLMYLMFASVFANDSVDTQGVSTVFATVTYVIVCFTCLLKIRYVGNSGGETVGQYFYLLVFVAAWITDTFAYFTGVFFGKHKLIPKVSPKKTVEGSVGGTVFCIIAFLVYAKVLSGVFEIPANYIAFAVFGLLLSVLSQMGDLLASAIKRCYGIKDYGRLFPGHGGVLDRFDSIMVLCPVLYICMGLLI